LDVAQVSKPAVSPISNRQNRRQFRGFGGGEAFAGWKPAIQQVWKPALPRVVAALNKVGDDIAPCRDTPP